jgi:signal transduction histidine kinase
LFNDIAHSIDQDSAFLQLINRYPFKDESELNEAIVYLKKNYFTGYWDKYEILITFCDSNKILDIQPENYTINCDDYFNDLIESYGIPTNFQNFIYLDHSTSPDNYLGKIDIHQNDRSVRLFVEVYSRFIPRGLGYPELLMDQKSKSTFNITPYSWAKYINNELIYHYGKYTYSLNLDDFIRRSDAKGFFNLNRYNHLYFPKNEDTIIIISKKNYGLIDIAAPFSYFFIFYGFSLLLFLLIFSRPIRLKQYQFHFKRRLQLSIISLVLISFVFIGVSSLFYIVTLNNNKNIDLLKEKSHSVLIELEHKLSTEETLSTEIEPYLSVLLYKLSLVFFSDINLYDLNGTLLATSRVDIFNKGLISPQMNTRAYHQMKYFKSSQFIHKETIGDYNYLSAYLPFRNVENQTIAYLNLPYFAKQNELTNEIVTYLTTFINIYVILIAIAVLITLAISNYISKPIQLLKEKISRLNLNRQNEKIDWVQHDEIGSLVDEYNRMVDELSKSAELLAKSERESAWREMAKQIAHEIKNPLTPMKLSVQYLQKSWDEKAPDWDQRLKRFTDTLVEQIESLSNIASEFSDFAKMPRSKNTVTDLNKIIENAIRLFTDTHQATFEFIPGEPHMVLADSEQLQRVFINLINNSIQAISDPAKGLINITVTKNDINHVIRLSDNGCGIPDEQKNKVFYPNFTTKSGGMGLGLAMVKNLIQNSGGEITFESEEGKGTTFIISLPAYME